MKPRSYALLGAVALVIAGGVLTTVLVSHRGPAPTPPIAPTVSENPVAPQKTTPAPVAPRATTPAAVVPPSKPVVPTTTEVTPNPAPEQAPAEPPSLRIDSPAAGSVYHSTVTLEGRLTGPGGASARSTMQAATWSITGTDTTGTIGVSDDGSFRAVIPTGGMRSDLTVSVQAAWKDGTTTESSVQLSGNAPGPDIVIATPRSQTSYGSSVTVTGHVSGPSDVANPLAEIDSVSWSLSGSNLGGAVPLAKDGSFAFSFSTVGERGDLPFSVTARDKNGRSNIATVTLNDRPTGPAIRVDGPADASSYGASVSVSGRVGDPADSSGMPADVKSFSWRVVGATSLTGEVSFQKDGAFRFSFPTDGLSGAQILELRAVDMNGRASIRTLAMRGPSQPPAQTVQGDPPGLTVNAPLDGTAYGATITLKGTATNTATDAGTDKVAKVGWSIAGSPLAGTADIGSDGAFTVTVKTAGLSGTIALSVRATANSGLASEKVVVLLDNEKGLAVAISSPQNGGYYKDATSISGRIGDGSSDVDIKSLTYDVVGTSSLNGRFAADATGTFKLALPGSQISGDITVRITAEDSRGHRSNASVQLHDGRLKPILVISAPVQGVAFGSQLRIAGKVTDPYATQPAMAGIDSLSWLVSPVDFARTSTPARGTAVVGENGAFRFSVPTAGLSGPQDVTLTAVAKNGNRSEFKVRVIQGDGDVPQFTVVPADSKITVTWPPVQFATRYDLSWASGGDVPEKGRTTTGATSPVVLSSLDNGTLYSVRMAVQFDDGGAGTTPLVSAIPLSPQTLVPTVKGDYMQIKLSWNTITGADSYDVWRSLAGAGTYAKIASAVRMTSYTDSSIDFGKDYSYQISPAGPIAPMSAAVTGRGLAFPSEKLASLGRAAVSTVRRVTLAGGYAYLSAGAAGVHIVDVSNPGSPADVGTMGTDNAWDVAVTTDYAYVADGESGLRVFDISAPRTPILIGTRKTSDARGVALSGSYAVVADGDKGIKIINVSDARTLERVGVLETQNARDVVMSDGRALLADGAGGLKVIDISRPAAPTIIGSLATTDARAVAVESGLAVVADGTGGLRVVNVKDPRNPTLLATFDVGMAAAVSLTDGFAYVADGSSGVKVVDLSDPAHPSLFTTHASNGAADVAVVDRVAYIAQADGLETMRVQIQGKSFRVASAETGGKAFAISVAGTWAYVASHAQGLRVLDVSDPTKLSDASLTGSATTRFAMAVNVADTLAFVADGSNGVRILDVSPSWDLKKPSPPLDVGAYRPGGSVNRVFPSGSFAYVAAGDQGLRVLDVSAPANPAEVGSVRTANALDVLVSGSWAYVADGDNGVKIIDVSTPAKPALQNAVIKGNAKALALSGSLLFASGIDGVNIIDVTNPAAPVLKGRYATSYAEAIAAAGNYLYVAEGFRGLTVVDVSRPTRPAVVSGCDDVFAVSVAVRGNYALVVDSYGVRVIRILIPDWLSQ